MSGNIIQDRLHRLWWKAPDLVLGPEIRFGSVSDLHMGDGIALRIERGGAPLGEEQAGRLRSVTIYLR